VIGPGALLDLEDLASVVRDASSGVPVESVDSGEWFDRIVFRRGNLVAWHSPARTCPIRWKVHSCREADALNALDGTVVRHPDLVFIRDGGSLRVFAIGHKGKTWAETKLFVPPYLNVSDKGSVCMPMNTRGRLGVEESETIFFDSAFSHLAHGNPSGQIRHPAGLAGFWVEYCTRCREKGVPRNFPLRRLAPLGKTLKEVVR
jgi:PRTRC genetic system protein B